MGVCQKCGCDKDGFIEEIKRLQARERRPLAIPSTVLLAEIVDAWAAYNKVNAEYTYHLEEGGDTDVTSTEVGELWDRLDRLIQRAANDNMSGAR